MGPVSFFRKDQGGEEASRTEAVRPGMSESASALPRPAANGQVVRIGVPTDEQALSQASQRVEEIGAASGGEGPEEDATGDSAPESAATPGLAGRRRGRPRNSSPGDDARWLDELPNALRAPTPRRQPCSHCGFHQLHSIM